MPHSQMDLVSLALLLVAVYFLLSLMAGGPKDALYMVRYALPHMHRGNLKVGDKLLMRGWSRSMDPRAFTFAKEPLAGRWCSSSAALLDRPSVARLATSLSSTTTTRITSIS